MKQSSKESVCKDFYATFGAKETQSSKTGSFVFDPSYHSSHPKSVKAMRKEIDLCLTSVTRSNISGQKHHRRESEQESEKKAKQVLDEGVLKRKNKELKKKKKKNDDVTEHSTAASNDKGPSQSDDKKVKKRNQKDGLSKHFTKKLKV